MLHNELRARIAAEHEDRARQPSAGTQHTVHLAPRRLLVGERMKPVDRDCRIEKVVLERQLSDITLHERDIMYAECVRTRTRRREHRGRVVEAGDVGVRQLRIHGQRETARADGHLKQFSLEPLMRRTQGKPDIAAHTVSVQPPHEPRDEFTRPRRVRHHPVIEIRKSSYRMIRPADLLIPPHFFVHRDILSRLLLKYILT